MSPLNPRNQPIGSPLPGWVPPAVPARTPMTGRYCVLEPMSERFAAELYDASSRDRDGHTWTYLPYGPLTSEDDYRRWIVETCLGDDPLFFVIVDAAAGRGGAFRVLLRRHLPPGDSGQGRNRDTARYAAIDSEWPGLAAAFEGWLAPENFDAAGRQKASLKSFRRAV